MHNTEVWYICSVCLNIENNKV